MTCKNCGEWIPDFLTACPVCGAKAPGGDDEKNAVPTPPPARPKAGAAAPVPNPPAAPPLPVSAPFKNCPCCAAPLHNGVCQVCGYGLCPTAAPQNTPAAFDENPYASAPELSQRQKSPGYVKWIVISLASVLVVTFVVCLIQFSPFSSPVHDDWGDYEHYGYIDDNQSKGGSGNPYLIGETATVRTMLYNQRSELIDVVCEMTLLELDTGDTLSPELQKITPDLELAPNEMWCRAKFRAELLQSDYHQNVYFTADDFCLESLYNDSPLHYIPDGNSPPRELYLNEGEAGELTLYFVMNKEAKLRIAYYDYEDMKYFGEP